MYHFLDLCSLANRSLFSQMVNNPLIILKAQRLNYIPIRLDISSICARNLTCAEVPLMQMLLQLQVQLQERNKRARPKRYKQDWKRPCLLIVSDILFDISLAESTKGYTLLCMYQMLLFLYCRLIGISLEGMEIHFCEGECLFNEMGPEGWDVHHSSISFVSCNGGRIRRFHPNFTFNYESGKTCFMPQLFLTP